MHERERWQMIVSAVQERPVVSVRDLVDRIGVSPATLRRDLTKLAGMGRVRRIHGGIEAVHGATRPYLTALSFEAGQTLNVERKRLIAKAAAALCEDGESIIINGGTTTYQMADFLIDRHLQILTNSFPIAQMLAMASDNRISLPGGEIFREQGLVLSPFDADATQHFTASRIFISCYSVSARGIIESDPLVARAVSKLLDRADRLVVLADSSKFEAGGSMVICPLSRVETLITDSAIAPAAADMVRSAGINLVIADGGLDLVSSAA